MSGRESFPGGSAGDEVSVHWRDDGTLSHRVLLTTYGFAPGNREGHGTARQLDVADLDRMISTLQRARRDAYGNSPATAVTLEVVERGHATDDTTPGSMIVPNEVRINGQPVLTQGGVRLHGAEYGKHSEMALATITLPVRMLTVAAEHDIHPADDGQADSVRS